MLPTSWTLPRGLLGFPDFTAAQFAFLPDSDGLYGVLTGTDGVEFVLARPGVFFPDYVVDVPDPAVAQLGLTGPDDADVWVLIAQRDGDITANLRGPVVVNTRTGVAGQVVLDGTHPTAAVLAA